MTRRLAVHLGTTRTGTLIERTDGRAEFHPDPNWVVQPRRPVLGQQFEDQPTKVWSSRRAVLPHWFENILPERDSPLRALISADAELDSDDDLGLLSHIGLDLPGATRIRAEPGPGVAPPDDIEEPSDEVKRDAGLGLKFSLAGIQLKFSLVERQQRYTLPGSGEDGRWVVKVARTTATPHVAENEFSMMSWARESGFDVPPTRLVEAQEVEPLPDIGPWQRAYAVLRFDRIEQGRVHQEDFAQILNIASKDKYSRTADQLAKVVLGVLGTDGFDELVRRLVFVVASGNADAHLKNWSVLYPDGIAPKWTPLYDQVSTVAWPQYDQELGLKVAGVKRMIEFDVGTIRRFCERAGIDRSRGERVAEDTLNRLGEGWSRCGAELPLVPEHRSALLEHWRRVPLLAPLR